MNVALPFLLIKTYFLGTEGGAVGDYFAEALLVAHHFTICKARPK